MTIISLDDNYVLAIKSDYGCQNVIRGEMWLCEKCDLVKMCLSDKMWLDDKFE